MILSTCQSAVGETASGEGIMNLVYAFMSSGVHCVSATLWQVLDESTRTITKGFYQRLKAGDDKTTALHTAKKQFLNDARFINDANLAHPRNWAGIQIVGDMRPLKLSEASNNNWLYRLTDNVKGKMRGVWQYILGTIVLTIGIFRKRLFKT